MQTSRLDRRSSSGGMGRLFEGPAAWLVTFLVIPALIVAVLLLPPVSLLDRLQTFTYTRIGVNGGAVTDPDGTTFQIIRGTTTGLAVAASDDEGRDDSLRRE